MIQLATIYGHHPRRICQYVFCLPDAHEDIAIRFYSEEDVLLGDLVNIAGDLRVEEGVRQPQGIDQVLRQGHTLVALELQPRNRPHGNSRRQFILLLCVSVYRIVLTSMIAQALKQSFLVKFPGVF